MIEVVVSLMEPDLLQGQHCEVLEQVGHAAALDAPLEGRQQEPAWSHLGLQVRLEVDHLHFKGHPGVAVLLCSSLLLCCLQVVLRTRQQQDGSASTRLWLAMWSSLSAGKRSRKDM